MNQGNLFTTKYILWSNFQMEKQDKNVEAYQLGAYVMQRMGINEGIMFRYHQKYFKEQNANESAYLDSMAVIEYDMLYGDKEVFGGENPYQPKNLKMGILPITLDRVLYKDGTMWLLLSMICCMVIKRYLEAKIRISRRILRWAFFQ